MYIARIVYTCGREQRTQTVRCNGLTFHESSQRAAVWLKKLKNWPHCRLNMAGIEHETAQPGQPRRWLLDPIRGMWDVIELAPEAAAPQPTTAERGLFEAHASACRLADRLGIEPPPALRTIGGGA